MNGKSGAERESERRVRVVDIVNLSSSANALLKERVLAMRRSGLDNRIVCMDGPHVLPLREAGIPVHTVHLPRGLDPLKLMVSMIEIAVYLRRNRVDLVHTHCSVPGAVGRIAAWLAGVPVIIHTVHGFHFHEGTPPLKRLLYLLVERLCGRLTDTLLTQNRSDLEQAERHGIGPRGRRWHVGNGIDLERFRPVAHRSRPGALVIMTCVARLEPVKNHAMLFEAARILKQRGERFRLRLVGEGTLWRDYECLCRRLGIDDRVEFLGYRDDLPALLSETDIAVLTSIKEGLPRAALEAMAMGVPVVATRVTGTREAVRHGETGLLVELGDVAGLAAALALLIGHPDLRARMGCQARRVAEEQFSETDVVRSLWSIYGSRLRARSIGTGSGALAGGHGDGLEPVPDC